MVASFFFFQPELKLRSLSDPSSNALDNNAKKTKVQHFDLTWLFLRSKQYQSRQLGVYSLCWHMAFWFLICQQGEDFSNRRASEPENPIYDYPRSYLRQKQVGLQLSFIFSINYFTSYFLDQLKLLFMTCHKFTVVVYQSNIKCPHVGRVQCLVYVF